MYSGCQGVHEQERIFILEKNIYIHFCKNLDGLGGYASWVRFVVFVVIIVHIVCGHLH